MSVNKIDLRDRDRPDEGARSAGGCHMSLSIHTVAQYLNGSLETPANALNHFDTPPNQTQRMDNRTPLFASPQLK